MSPPTRRQTRVYTTLACEQCKKSKTKCIQLTNIHESNFRNNNESNKCWDNNYSDNILVKQEQKANKFTSPSSTNNSEKGTSGIEENRYKKDERDSEKKNLNEIDPDSNEISGINQCNPSKTNEILENSRIEANSSQNHLPNFPVYLTFTVNTNANNNNQIDAPDRSPCERCMKRNLKCEYVVSSKKRGPKTRNAKMLVENLVTREDVNVNL
ncbi:1359_t:CDS:1 [Acaulospora morrowiae]|uniref:1359_t:CDS:1 n=1 Tax=Acaulospora morrowiae TaxID=94023 RepID=A0A9N9F3L2_9GLOM|nr:1359_t:CDS:1 [Acaulospora morrowiae]